MCVLRWTAIAVLFVQLCVADPNQNWAKVKWGQDKEKVRFTVYPFVRSSKLTIVALS
jgi:hypothetical protein